MAKSRKQTCTFWMQRSDSFGDDYDIYERNPKTSNKPGIVFWPCESVFEHYFPRLKMTKGVARRIEITIEIFEGK